MADGVTSEVMEEKTDETMVPISEERGIEEEETPTEADVAWVAALVKLDMARGEAQAWRGGRR